MKEGGIQDFPRDAWRVREIQQEAERLRETEKQKEVQHLLRKIKTFIDEHPNKYGLYDYTHEHPLTLSEVTESTDAKGVRCPECQQLIGEGPAYVCNSCKFFIHKSCKELPLNVHRNFHMRHFLSLLQHFKPDIPTKLVEPRPPQYSSSSRPQFFCYACELPFLGPTYGCTKCSLYIHKFCAELPLEIQHPLHPAHSLELTHARDFMNRIFMCNICERTCRGFAYFCSKCNFQVDLHCMFLKPTIYYPTHNHPLTLLQEQSTNSLQPCSGCGENFSSSPPAIRCVQCRINFHVQCLLPSNIRSTHVHPLVLAFKSLQEDDLDDEHCICDSCEERRIQNQPVYQCAEGCSYVAHVDCAYASSERVNMTAEQEVIGHNSDEWSEHIVSLENLFNSLTMEDRKEVEDIISAVPVEQVLLRRVGYFHKLDPNEPFDKLMSKFDSPTYRRVGVNDPKLYYSRPSSEVVKIGDHMIPQVLAPVMEALLAKYGDLSAKSTMSLKVNSCIYIALCEVVYHMCKTKFKDLDELQVFNWRNWFLYAQIAGFEVQFALEYLKKMLCAFFGLHAILRALAVVELGKDEQWLLNTPVLRLGEEFFNESSAVQEGLKILDHDGRIKGMANAIVHTIMNENTYIFTADKVEKMFNIIFHHIKDLEENLHNELGEEDFSEKNSEALLIEMLYNDDPEEMFKIICTVRKFILAGGPKRLLFNVPPFISISLQLSRKLQGHVENTAGEEVAATSEKFFQLLIQIIKLLKTVPANELEFRSYLQCAEAANDCNLEPVTYDFFYHACILYQQEYYEESPVTAVHLLIETLQKLHVFGVEKRNNFASSVKWYSLNLLEKTDQCRAICACSHLFWVDDNDYIRDGKMVLICLEKAFEIANKTRTSSESVILFVEVLDKYLYFFEMGIQEIGVSTIQGLIELIKTELQSDNLTADTAANSFASTLGYIQFRKQEGGAMSEKYEPIKV